MKQMTPDKLEQLLRELPRTADTHLADLTAGPHLKARIQLAATQSKPTRSSLSLTRLMPVMCCVAALALVLVLGPMLRPTQNDLITAGPLGNTATSVPADLYAGLGGSDIHIKAGHRNPGYRSIWADTKDGSFPLIGVNGRYYRLLTSPLEVDGNLLGKSLGTIAEFTTEPSLSGSDVMLSNVVPFGESVYALRGMEGTLVAAPVNGRMRLFQRVSYNGNALRGRESLADTLQVSGRVIAMELSGVGTITDPAVCENLLATLLDCASYDSSGSIGPKQSLLIELDNSLVIQMAVRSDRLSACGTWSCPEFFEAFEDACE